MPIQYKSVSMQEVGLEKISGISDSRCKRLPISATLDRVLGCGIVHRVITNCIQLLLQQGNRDHPKTHPLTDFTALSDSVVADLYCNAIPKNRQKMAPKNRPKCNKSFELPPWPPPSAEWAIRPSRHLQLFTKRGSQALCTHYSTGWFIWSRYIHCLLTSN